MRVNLFYLIFNLFFFDFIKGESVINNENNIFSYLLSHNIIQLTNLLKNTNKNNLILRNSKNNFLFYSFLLICSFFSSYSLR